jgi:hypothetical protein
MSRSTLFILTGSVWTLSTVLVAAGLQVPSSILVGTGWMLAIAVFLSCCLALSSAINHSPLLRSMAFIANLLAPLAWTLWVGAMQSTVFSFSTWGLVSLMALVGATVTEHGLEWEFERGYSGEAALQQALREAATPILGTPALDTGSLKIPHL